ncbi:hypothetical protein ABS71_16510 [bacterium SCN 62-11]|nr:MAG: hypothetical protein ABS71_16510 [bacterium SCN 62-11]
MTLALGVRAQQDAQFGAAMHGVDAPQPDVAQIIPAFAVQHRKDDGVLALHQALIPALMLKGADR